MIDTCFMQCKSMCWNTTVWEVLALILLQSISMCEQGTTSLGSGYQDENKERKHLNEWSWEVRAPIKLHARSNLSKLLRGTLEFRFAPHASQEHKNSFPWPMHAHHEYITDIAHGFDNIIGKSEATSALNSSIARICVLAKIGKH